MTTGWKHRLFYGLAMWTTGLLHHALVRDVANTPAGMFAYHFSACMVDAALLVLATHVLAGRLADDMRVLCLLSMAVNAVGWFLYLAYAPPIPYDYAIGALGYVQYLRLITRGIYGSDRAGGYLFRGHDPVRPQLHPEKAQR